MPSKNLLIHLRAQPKPLQGFPKIAPDEARREHRPGQPTLKYQSPLQAACPRGAPHRPATTTPQKLPLREDLPPASLPQNPRSGGGWDFQSKEWQEAESLSGAITER